MRSFVVIVMLIAFASCTQTRVEEYWDYNPSVDTNVVGMDTTETIMDSLE